MATMRHYEKSMKNGNKWKAIINKRDKVADLLKAKMVLMLKSKQKL